MASAMYNEFKKEMGKIDWSDNAGIDIKVLLVDNTYAQNIDLHLNKDDIDTLSVEINATGYTAGGTLLTTRVVTIDLPNDWAVYDADDAIWGSSTITARGAIVYLDTGTPATSTLIAYIDFVSDKSSDAGDFVVQWHTDGVYRLG